MWRMGSLLGIAGAGIARRVLHAATKVVSLVEKEAAKAGESAMSFMSVLKWIGHEVEVVLSDVVKYALPIERLVGLIFPPAEPVVQGVIDATTLIQNAVLLVEQKWSKSSNASGAQKLADVLTLTESTVISLLAKAGVKADTAYVTNLVNAVVAILNIQEAPQTASSTGTLPVNTNPVTVVSAPAGVIGG